MKLNPKILAFIYNSKTNKFLVLKIGDSDEKTHGKSKWFSVTGSVEKGESGEEAVRREVFEETGLEVREVYDLKWGCRYNWQNQTHQEMYFVAFVEDEEVNLDGIEVINYKWVDLEEYIKLIAWGDNKKNLKRILSAGIKKEIGISWTKIDDYTGNRNRTIFSDKGREVISTFVLDDGFSKLEDVRQCYGVCFDEVGRILVISNKKNNWSLPGGKPEGKETFEETLIREVDEEANVDISDIVPLAYNKVEEIFDGKNIIYYQLRFVARVKKAKGRKIDPATNKMFERKFIDPEEFSDYLTWGSSGEEMVRAAVKVFKERLQ